MSDEKHQALIDAGQLNPDGTRKVVCPTCGSELPPDHPLVVGPGDAVAEPEAVQMEATAPDSGG